MRWFVVMSMCLIGLLTMSGCGPKAYERHIEPSYTQGGTPRPGYLTLNVEYLNALNDDLQACYRNK